MTEPRIERRRAPRAPAAFPIQVYLQGEFREALVKDLSCNGICCTHPGPIEEMSLVRLEFQLPAETERHIVQGAVVRCREICSGNPPTCEIALFFTEVPAATQAALAIFVEHYEGEAGTA